MMSLLDNENVSLEGTASDGFTNEVDVDMEQEEYDNPDMSDCDMETITCNEDSDIVSTGSDGKKKKIMDLTLGECYCHLKVGVKRFWGSKWPGRIANALFVVAALGGVYYLGSKKLSASNHDDGDLFDGYNSTYPNSLSHTSTANSYNILLDLSKSSVNKVPVLEESFEKTKYGASTNYVPSYDADNLRLDDFDEQLSFDLSEEKNSYNWKEEGHNVRSHLRHYKDGRETIVKSYYKPTGSLHKERDSMPKYKIIYYWSDGTTDEDDNYGEYYSTKKEAEDAGLYGLGCAKLGGEILEMSNPGDYPYDESDYEDDTFEIVEVDD